MKKTTLLFATFCLLILLAGCKPEATVAYNAADPFEGFACIKLTEYQSYLDESLQLLIYRKRQDEVYDRLVYMARVNMNPAPSGQSGTLIHQPDFIDFYTEPGVEYTYSLNFIDTTYNSLVVISDISVTPLRGFGEIAVDPGRASFTSDGKLTFSKLPTVNFKELPLPYTKRLRFNYWTAENDSWGPDVFVSGSVSDAYGNFQGYADPSQFLNKTFNLEMIEFTYSIITDNVQFAYVFQLTDPADFESVPTSFTTPASW